MSYRLITLYSGSSGNSTLVSTGNTSILIDAGKSARTLCNALNSVGSDIRNISAIFITHEHSDHISALETISKKYGIPIHMTEQSAKKLDRYSDSSVQSCLVRHNVLFEEKVGDMTVASFRTPHDSLMSVGYRIEFSDENGDHALGVATDIGHVTKDITDGLSGCEAVVLESNHDEQMLEDGPYPYYLKLRIRSSKGHLSNSDSACLASILAENGTRGFILAHLSRENNLPELAYDEAHSAISDPSVKIRIAHPDEPVELEV
jgi:phosphoribosyl 1,2-cyclic phosphodiesterase